jgi:hypothetical protein
MPSEARLILHATRGRDAGVRRGQLAARADPRAAPADLYATGRLDGSPPRFEVADGRVHRDHDLVTAQHVGADLPLDVVSVGAREGGAVDRTALLDAVDRELVDRGAQLELRRLTLEAGAGGGPFASMARSWASFASIALGLGLDHDLRRRRVEPQR